jgi:signal peptidase I
MFFHYLLRTFHFLFTTVVALVIVRTFVVGPGRVNGPSMEPVFLDDDFFLVNKITLLLREPRRGDIVQAVHPTRSDRLIIKRIIALPGERILIRQNRVFIETSDGSTFALREPYLPDSVSTFTPNREPLRTEILPPFTYFVLGDNREGSVDSRDFGPLHRSLIYGLVFAPFRGR